MEESQFTCPSLLIFALATQFHVYLPWVNTCLAKCLKCESASKHFQPREGPSRGLPVIVKSSRTFVWSSIYQTAGISVGLRLLRKQGQWQMQKSKRRIKYQNLPTFWTGLTQCV